MILFYGLPPQIYGQNGMLRRIAHIDSLFNEKERIYCYPFQYTGKEATLIPNIEKITEKVSFFPCDFQHPLHNELFVSLLKQSDFLYAHTVHSAQFLYPYYDSGKIITDLHGIAPEEEEMFGHANRARFYEAYERTLIQKSYRVIGVTQKMYQHYDEKYGLPPDRFIYLPIAPNIISAPRENKSEKTHIIYSGGTQIWQQIPRMLDAVEKLSDNYQFLFLSQQKNELEQLARKKGVLSSIKVDSCTEKELPQYYAWADYGFCLRESSPVNRVSCPTKLMEYAASGVIPIIDSNEIGDFFTMGGRAVTLEQLLHEETLNRIDLEAIQEANYAVIDRLQENIQEGERILRHLSPPASPLTESEWQFCFLDTESRTTLFPATGKWQGKNFTEAVPDICTYSHQVNLTLPEINTDINYYVAPLPAILQSPDVYTISKNGIKSRITYSHNFRHFNKHWLALPGRNKITIPADSLQNCQAIMISIRILAAGNKVYAENKSLLKNMKRLANILLPAGTKRREYAKVLARKILG